MSKQMYQGTKEDAKRILDYIGKDYGKCAYLYIDMRKYGFENEHVHVWVQENDQNEINVVLLQYYNGMHLFSRDNSFDGKLVADIIKTRSVAMVCDMKDTIEKVSPYFPDNDVEIGKVVMLKEYSGIQSKDSVRAKRKDLGEIVDLLMTDEVMGGPYTRELLYSQFLERYDDNFGRSYIHRDESNGKIIAHSGTYAELDDIAVISGGIVASEYRKNGEYARILGSVCKELWEEHKTVISYYYKVAAWSHKKVGFEELGEWAKLKLAK